MCLMKGGLPSITSKIVLYFINNLIRTAILKISPKNLKLMHKSHWFWVKYIKYA